MVKEVYIGIDPGVSGFITIYDSQKDNYEFLPMPTEKVETGKLLKSGKPQMESVFSEKGLASIVFTLGARYKGYKKYAAIEEVTGREGWSAQNSFNFGLVAGMQRMIAIMLGCEITPIRPQKWQSYMRQGYPDIKKPSSTGKTMVIDAKAIAEIIVKKEFPNIDFRKTERSKVNDHNKVDSFLLCTYLYRVKNE